MARWRNYLRRANLKMGNKKKRFISQMKHEIKMMYVMKDHASMEDLFNVALDL
jgi:hypothetical protein